MASGYLAGFVPSELDAALFALPGWRGQHAVDVGLALFELADIAGVVGASELSVWPLASGHGGPRSVGLRHEAGHVEIGVELRAHR